MKQAVTATTILSPMETHDSPCLEAEERIRIHWKASFVGNNVQTLMQKIGDYEDASRGSSLTTKYCSKVIPLIQNSGVGKSRLADAVGELCVTVHYFIRDYSGGYPACDDEILEFLQSQPSIEDVLAMSLEKNPDSRYQISGRVHRVHMVTCIDYKHSSGHL